MQTVAKPAAPSVVSGNAVRPPLPDELPLQRVYRWEKETPQQVFLTQPVAGEVRDWTWSQAMDETRRMAAFLSSQNWPPGSRIVILSKNCAWWIMAELAIWMSGHISVPVYASLSAHAIRALLDHCEPVAVFIGVVEDRETVADGIPPGVLRISFPTARDPEAISWSEVLNTWTPTPQDTVRPPDDIATIIYTSGTTGAPKGAMHRFSSFVYFATAAIRTHNEHRGGRMLSYLPLAHIAERALVEAVAFTNSTHLYFVESIDTFIDDLRRARPTVFFSVPRLYVKFQHQVLEKVPQRKLDRLLSIPLVGWYVKRKILKQLGLDCAILSASGGAALPLSTLLWFRKLGLNLVEGYGMTETGITHTPPNRRSKPGYVGDSIPGVETRIAINGEVQVRSPMNMVGYFKNPQATQECFTEDGFFRTGDLGEVDDEGWLRIIGRVKEQFKTSKGKYVSPNPIEKLLSANASIDSCCVMGEGMNQPFAVLTLSAELREKVQQPAERAAIEEELKQLMGEVNRQLEPHERLQFLVVTDQPWSVANGMLTPTMKLKRKALETIYGALYAFWSEQRTEVIWHSVASGTHAAGQSGT